MLRQAQHRHAVAFDGFNRNQMLIVEPMRHVEQRVARMRGTALGGERRPRGVAQRHIQRLGLARLLPGRDMIGECALGERLAEPRFQIGAQRGAIEAAMDRHTSSPPGAARTAACTRGSDRARGSRAPAPASPPRCRTARRRTHRDAARAPPPVRSHPEWRAHPVRHAPRAVARAARHRPPRDDRGRSDPAAPDHRAPPGRRC